MLKFIKGYLKKKEGQRNYFSKLKHFLSDNKLSDNEKNELKEISEQYGLSEGELKDVQGKALNITYSALSNDRRITEEEKDILQELINYFNLEKKDIKWDHKTFSKFYTLALIDKGVLPEIKDHDLDVFFKENEKLHWACAATLKKVHKVTERVNYRGLGGSIKIMKGVRYRMGSLNVSTGTKESLANEDIGSFWITSTRIGFKGKIKNFTIHYSKILSFELNSNGLMIMKEGKETPYIVGLDDYEVPCAMLSFILNS